MDEASGEEKYQRYTAQEMDMEIDKIRHENGWKPRKRNKPSHSTSSRKSNGSLPSLDSLPGGLEEQYRLLQRLQQEAVERERRKREDQEQTKLQKEALRLEKLNTKELTNFLNSRILREAERRDKQDMAKREREMKHQQFTEEKRRKQDEMNRQKQEEKLKKMHEVELKRQQAAIYKEQVGHHSISWCHHVVSVGRGSVSHPSVGTDDSGSCSLGHVPGPVPGRWPCFPPPLTTCMLLNPSGGFQFFQRRQEVIVKQLTVLGAGTEQLSG